MSESRETGLRDRKKSQTRADIAHAAVRLLVEQGPEHATIGRIAEEAGVSSRTFHNYFPHREAAMFHYLENLLELLRDNVLNSPDGLALTDVAQRVATNLYFHGEPNSMHALKVVEEHLSHFHLSGGYVAGETSPIERPVDMLAPLVGAFRDYARRNGRELSAFEALILITNAISICAVVYETRDLAEYAQANTESEMLAEAFAASRSGFAHPEE